MGKSNTFHATAKLSDIAYAMNGKDRVVKSAKDWDRGIITDGITQSDRGTLYSRKIEQQKRRRKYGMGFTPIESDRSREKYVKRALSLTAANPHGTGKVMGTGVCTVPDRPKLGVEYYRKLLAGEAA